MYLPGQPVLISIGKGKQALGLYLGAEEVDEKKQVYSAFSTYTRKAPTLYALVYTPEKASAVVDVFNIEDFCSVREEANTITGGQINYGPKANGKYKFLLPKWTSVTSNEQISEQMPEMLGFLKELYKQLKTKEENEQQHEE